jgi:NitT/TauT family transport system substrate-binding protein
MKRSVRGRQARFIALLAAVGVALSIGVVGSSAATAQRAGASDNGITLGLPGIPPVFLGVRQYVAQQQGYYRKYGADVTLKGFTTGTDAARAVVAGQIDAAWAPTPLALSLISKNNPIIGIEGMDVVDWLVGSIDGNVRTCANLKGQTIGIDTVGGARYQALQAMLSKCHLTIQDVHTVNFPGNTATLAMIAGQLKTSVLHIDEVAQMKSQGTNEHTVVRITDVDPFQHYDLLIVNKNALAAKRDQLVRMLAGDIAATRYIYNKKALNRVAQIATVTGDSVDVAKGAIQAYVKMKWWPLNRSGLGSSKLTRTIYENVKLGNISAGAVPTYRQVADSSLWKQAYKMVNKKKHK